MYKYYSKSIYENLQWNAMLSIAKPHGEDNKAEPGNLCGNHLLPGVSGSSVHVGEPIFLVGVPVLLKSSGC